MLLEKLSHKFSGKNSDDFTLAFGSVLGDLEEREFQKLRDMRNIFYVFGVDPVGGIRSVDFKDSVRFTEKEKIRIVVFGAQGAFQQAGQGSDAGGV